MNQDIIARGKKETSGKYQCCGSLQKLYMLRKEQRAAPFWKSRLPWSPLPHILLLVSLCSLILGSWQTQAEIKMEMVLNGKKRSLALLVLLRKSLWSSLPYSIWPCFPPPQARCPRMSTGGSEEPRHGSVLHKWDNFCQSLDGVKQHLSQDEVMITQMRTAQLLHSCAPNTMTFLTSFRKCPFM